MSGIQRFDMHGGDGRPCYADDGDWVDYMDHKIEVDRLRARVAELEEDSLMAHKMFDDAREQWIMCREALAKRESVAVPGVWMREFVDAVEREAFKMRAPNTHTPVLVGMWSEAKRRLLAKREAVAVPDAYQKCLRDVVKQLVLMMDDCEEHAGGRITIDNDSSEGFLRRIYDLLNALEIYTPDCVDEAFNAMLAASQKAAKGEGT